MHKVIVFAIYVGACGSIGCGATLRTERVSIKDPPKCVNGLVVNQNVPYEVVAVFPKTPDGKVVDHIDTRLMLPSQDEAYVIGYRGQLFTSRTLEVELHADTTVKRVKVASDAQTEQMFKDLNAAAGQAAIISHALNKPPVDKEAEEDANEAKALCRTMLDQNKKDAAAGEALTYPETVSCK